jgi:hypothetical protein
MRDPFARAIADRAALVMFQLLAGEAGIGVRAHERRVKIRARLPGPGRREDAAEDRRVGAGPLVEIRRRLGGDDPRERDDEAVAFGAERDHHDGLPGRRRRDGMTVVGEALIGATSVTIGLARIASAPSMMVRAMSRSSSPGISARQIVPS